MVQLPSDHPRPAMQSFRGAIHPVVLSRELGDALKLLSRRERATLFMTLVASFAAATLSWKYIERPFRRPSGQRKSAGPLVVAGSAICAERARTEDCAAA